MNYSLIVRREAEQDLRDAYEWYEERRAGIGDDFLLCVDAAVESILDGPLHYPALHENIRRVLVRRFPYGVFYIVDGVTVVILAVMHCSRDPRAWEGRTA